MSILSVASGNSMWRGLDYFRNGRVISCIQTGETEFCGRVRGSKNYEVKIDYSHPLRSVCDCPQANGKRRVCKHMVALYFAAFPAQAELIIKQSERWEEQEEVRHEDIYDRVGEYIQNMSAEEAKSELYSLLMDSSEDVFDRFVSEHCLDSPEEDNNYLDEESFNRIMRTVCDCIEMSSDEVEFYYNKKSKEVIFGSEYEGICTADLDDDDIIRLPDKHDFDEYNVMKEFAQRQPDKIKDALLEKLHGRGVYRRFKDAVINFGIEKFWYAYRNECMRIFAESWCCDNIL